MVSDRVMLDIETIGLEPGVVVTSIGAVRFTRNGVTDDTFHRGIRLSSCTDVGLEIDGDTLEWWLDQSRDARQEIKGGRPLLEVLDAYAEWHGDADEVWANSPAFDCSILEAAYDAVGLVAPWEYYEQRDFRTLSSLPIAPDYEHEGTAHNALDDAKHQARVAAETLRRIAERDE